MIGTDLISPVIDPSNSWTIEIALDSDGLLPEITSVLAEAELVIRDAIPILSRSALQIPDPMSNK